MKFLRAVREAKVRDFRQLGEEYIDRVCTHFPEVGSHLGFRKFDAELGDNSTESWKAFGRACDDLLARVEALPATAFSGNDWLDRRCFLALLRTNQLSIHDFGSWKRNPQQSINGAIESVFQLVLRAGTRLKPVLPKIRSRLRKIPDYLAAGAVSIKAPDPLWQELTEETCAGGVEFFRDLEPALTAAAGEEAASVRSEIEGVIRAIEAYAATVGRKRAAKRGSFSVGRERFELLVRERLGFDQSLPELMNVGESLVAEMDYLMGREAARLGRKTADELLAEAREQWTPDRPLLEVYREQTTRIRDRVAEAGLVTLPEGESLEVRPVPAFMRNHFPTAAYSAPGAFEKQQKGVFWVNDLSLTEPNPRKQRAERQQHFGLELTCGHEAYPGHHLQFVLQFRHPSRIRRLCEHAIFYEGWTLWCERMLVDEKIVDEPWARLIQLHDALWRACRIVIDCGLHGGTMSYDAACRYLMKNVGFTRARARADVNWYTASPTVPMSYLLGRLEMEKLHRKLVLGDGWTLRQFNDWLLSFGAVPQRWIWKASLDEAAV